MGTISRMNTSSAPRTSSSLGRSSAPTGMSTSARLSTASRPASPGAKPTAAKPPARVTRPPNAGNSTASVGGRFGKIEVQTGINNGSGPQIQVQNGSGNATIHYNGPAATPSASSGSQASGPKPSASATSPAGSPKPPAPSGSPTGGPKPPTPAAAPSGSPATGPTPAAAPSGSPATGPTPAAAPSGSPAPSGVNLTKAKNPTASVETQFGKIEVQTGINNGSGPQIQVQNGSGNVTINYNSPAAAKEDGAKGKWDWKALIKETAKGAKDTSDAGLKVIKEGYDGAVKTASK